MKQNKDKLSFAGVMGDKNCQGPVSSMAHWIKQHPKLLRAGVPTAPGGQWKVCICDPPVSIDPSGSKWDPLILVCHKKWLLMGGWEELLLGKTYSWHKEGSGWVIIYEEEERPVLLEISWISGLRWGSVYLTISVCKNGMLLRVKSASFVIWIP